MLRGLLVAEGCRIGRRQVKTLIDPDGDRGALSPSAHLPTRVNGYHNTSNQGVNTSLLNEANGNKSPTNQPFEGLTDHETNPDATGRELKVFKIDRASKHPLFHAGTRARRGPFIIRTTSTNICTFRTSGEIETEDESNYELTKSIDCRL
jgi:hypothetical protein